MSGPRAPSRDGAETDFRARMPYGDDLCLDPVLDAHDDML